MANKLGDKIGQIDIHKKPTNNGWVWVVVAIVILVAIASN